MNSSSPNSWARRRQTLNCSFAQWLLYLNHRYVSILGHSWYTSMTIRDCTGKCTAVRAKQMVGFGENTRLWFCRVGARSICLSNIIMHYRKLWDKVLLSFAPRILCGGGGRGNDRLLCYRYYEYMGTCDCRILATPFRDTAVWWTGSTASSWWPHSCTSTSPASLSEWHTCSSTLLIINGSKHNATFVALLKRLVHGSSFKNLNVALVATVLTPSSIPV